MKIKYVGVKEDGETAFSHATGITWYPGSSEDIPTAIAVKMLQHPDVFERDEADAPSLAASITPPSTPGTPSTIPVGAAPNSPAALIEPETLLGSDILPAQVEIAGEKVALGTIVAAAFKLSGMTVAVWNGLSGASREDLLADQIKILEAEAALPVADVIELKGERVVITGLERPALLKLAQDNGLTPHHQTGAAKLTAALLAAFPVKS